MQSFHSFHILAGVKCAINNPRKASADVTGRAVFVDCNRLLKLQQPNRTTPISVFKEILQLRNFDSLLISLRNGVQYGFWVRRFLSQHHLCDQFHLRKARQDLQLKWTLVQSRAIVLSCLITMQATQSVGVAPNRIHIVKWPRTTTTNLRIGI